MLERRDPGAVEPLRAIVSDGNSAATSVVLALHMLEAQGALTDDLLRQSLQHPSAPVRENAIALVEPRLASDSRWLVDLLPLARDKDSRVLFQTAIAIGAARPDAEGVSAALASMTVKASGDRWMRAAIFSSMAGREIGYLGEIKGRGPIVPELYHELGRLLVASLPKDEWPALLKQVVGEVRGFMFGPDAQAAILTGFCESARGRLASRSPGGILAALVNTADSNSAVEKNARLLLAEMKKLALDPGAPIERRRTAIGLLAFASFDEGGETLLTLLNQDQPIVVRSAAVRALGAHRDPRVATMLLAADRFAAYTPDLRDEVLSAILSQHDHIPGLLSALEEGRIPTVAVDALRRRQLTQDGDASIKKRADALFGAVSGDRAKVYDEYKAVADWPADPVKGRAVFKRECASCHRLDRDGSSVGPDLFGIRNQPKASILLHILVPDHEITQGFSAYTVAIKDGRVLTGLISSESPTSITLRQPLGKEDTILRSEIDDLIAGKQSLMPQGLEKGISRQEFADLLGYLKGEGEPAP